MYFDGIIDLSHHNGPSAITGLEDAYKSGIRVVIHKATQGTSFVDKQFRAVRDEARRLGMLFGSYHFGTSADPTKQAEHYLQTIDDGKTENELAILDLEAHTDPKTSMSILWATMFVSLVKEGGTGSSIEPSVGSSVGLYTTSSYLSSLVRKQTKPLPTLHDCWLWLARYNNTIEPEMPFGWSRSWDMWQYTDKSSVPGIGPCDRSRFRGSYDDLVRFWHLGARRLKANLANGSSRTLLPSS